MNKLPDANSPSSKSPSSKSPSSKSPSSKPRPVERSRAPSREGGRRSRADGPPRILPRIRSFADDLPTPYLRLIGAAHAPLVDIVPDPIDPDRLLRERRRQGDVTLAGASHERQTGEDLVVAGLIEWKPGDPSIIALTPQGLAYVRRRRQVYEARLAAEDDLAQGAPDDDAPERAEPEDDTVVVDGVETNVTRNPAESPLAWLVRRRGRDGERLIGPSAYAAGERLRRDITLGGLMPATTMRWSAVPVVSGGGAQGPAQATDAMIAARQRVRHALEAVGPDDAGLLMDVCGFLKSLAAIERERRWAARSAKVMLRVALARLAAHYGFEDEARGREAGGRIRSWRDGEELL